MIDIPAPSPAEAEVRIRVHAASVNPTDTLLRSGKRVPGGVDGVNFTPIWIVDYSREHGELDELRQHAEDCALTLQVAETVSTDKAPEARRRQEKGGVRGRLVLEF